MVTIQDLVASTDLPDESKPRLKVVMQQIGYAEDNAVDSVVSKLTMDDLETAANMGGLKPPLTIREKRALLAQLQPSGAHLLAQDADYEVADAMFAPFEEASFPLTLKPLALQQLLATPLAARCPIPPVLWPHYSQLANNFFEQDPTRIAPELQIALGSALKTREPRGSPTELLLTPFWTSVGMGLPELASSILGFDIVINRNIVDCSITIENKRRDYMVMVGNVLVVGGEDKAEMKDLKVAQQEVFDKHKGSNASLYGRLGYIILMVTAGPLLAVHSLDLLPGASADRPPILVEAFNMVVPGGRRKALQIMVNITRWLRTIQTLELLPPPPPAPLFVNFHRPSPYHEFDGFTGAEVTLQLHFRHVEKTFRVPQHLVETLCMVYQVLALDAIPHAVGIKCFKLGPHVMNLRQQPLILPRLDGPPLVELSMAPVGARFLIKTAAQLRGLAISLLETAAALHLRGFVHRDIREDNVVHHCENWILIDWELAGPIGARVWWSAREQPPGFQMGSQWPIAADLWQIGRIIQRHAELDPLFPPVAQGLLSGGFHTAAEALAVLSAG